MAAPRNDKLNEVALAARAARMRVQPRDLTHKPPERPWPKAYWITFYREVSNTRQTLPPTPSSRSPATAPFGAKYLARGTAAAAYESGVMQRVVVTEFESLEKAKAAHDSPAYRRQ